MDAHVVGNKIAELRKSLNLTQQQLAEALLVTNKAVSKWETGNGLPDILMLPSLAAVLGVSVDEIISNAPVEGARLSIRRYFKKPVYWTMIAAVIALGAMLTTRQFSPFVEAAQQLYTPLQEATGSTGKKLEYIEELLDKYNVAYKTVVPSSNPIIDGMDTNWVAYDLIDESGDSYVLILRKSDQDFTAILNSNGLLLEGMIDSGVTPALFINGNYKYDRSNFPIPGSQRVIDDPNAIVFPVSDNAKTEHNAFVYDIESFALSVQLPENWSFWERSPEVVYLHLIMDAVWSVLDIFDENNELVGAVGYNVYEEYEDAEDDPRAIYNQIALGNHYHFDVRDSYTAIKETETGTTAMADVYYSAQFNAGEEKYDKGILSYNRDLLVYIAMEFESGWITDEQLRSIAESVCISSVSSVSEGFSLESVDTVYSPDGKYFIEGYGVNFSMRVSGMNPVEQFRIVEAGSGKTLWDMEGLFIPNTVSGAPPFGWSPDSRYVYIAHMGRPWMDGLIVDTMDFSEQSLPGMPMLAAFFPDTTPDDNRPDPYIEPLFWLDDTTLTIEFSWLVKEDIGVESNRIQGEYIFYADTGEFYRRW